MPSTKRKNWLELLPADLREEIVDAARKIAAEEIDVTGNALHKAFQQICEERNVKPPSDSSFVKSLYQLVGQFRRGTKA